MSSDLKVGNLSAAKGEKVQGYLNVLDTDLKIPVTLINGSSSDKTVVITSGIHGGEYSGIETSIRLASMLQPNYIKGNIIIAHPVNTSSFSAKSQYVVPNDGKNLNRMFPGNQKGTVSEKIAYVITNELLRKADFYIDLHCGDIHEELAPFLVFTSFGSEEVSNLSKKAASFMGVKYVLELGHTASTTTIGAANKMDVPGFLAEIGQCGVWSEDEVITYIKGVENVLKSLNILSGNTENLCEDVIHMEEVSFVEAASNGCWYPCVKAGQVVNMGDKIGEIRDFFSNVLCEYFCEKKGVILCITSSLAINEKDPIYEIGHLK